MKPRLSITVLCTLFTLSGSSVAALPKTTVSSGVIPQAASFERYGELPLSFEMNQGQSDAQVKFLSRGQGYNLYLTSGEAMLAPSKSALQKTGYRSDASNSKEAAK